MIEERETRERLKKEKAEKEAKEKKEVRFFLNLIVRERTEIFV